MSEKPLLKSNHERDVISNLLYYKLLVNFIKDQEIILLITAQEVAGLNPAEVNENEEVNASSLLFRVTKRVTI